MVSQPLIVLLFLSLSSCIYASTLLKISDSNWYFTEFNWFKSPDGTYAQTNYPGAYFKIGFTGTSAVLLLNQTGAASTEYAIIKYVIDNKPASTFSLPAQNESVILASGLASGSHTLAVYVQASSQAVDRWNVPNNVFRVTGLQIDDGGASVAVPLRSKRMLVFWDSIGEGVLVLGSNGNDLNSNEATMTWAYALAAGLDAEVSMSAFGRLGYVVPGNGNVPPLYTPNDDSSSSWNKIDASHARDFSVVPLDYVFCGHGTNDGGQQEDVVMAHALGWLIAQRAAVQTSTKIFMTVPFGGFNLAAISDAFQTYQTKYNDPNTFFLNMTETQYGLSGGGGTWESVDGIHPLAWRDGQIGAIFTRYVVTAQ